MTAQSNSPADNPQQTATNPHTLDQKVISIRHKIQKLMDSRIWGIADLAEKSGLNPEQLRRILSDTKPQRPRRKTLGFIAKSFGLEVEDLLAGTDWPQRQVSDLVATTATAKPPIHVRTSSGSAAFLSPHFHFYNGEEALRVITTRLEKSTVVLNTGIMNDRLPIIQPTPAMAAWTKAALAAIRTCSVFKDVSCKAWLSVARDRFREARKAKREKGKCGVYDCRCIPCPQGGFLNFTVFEYDDGSKEVFFGWLLAEQQGLEQPCVSTTEAHVVQLFEVWHGQLFAKGKDPRSMWRSKG